jgi:hypothetical protein
LKRGRHSPARIVSIWKFKSGCRSNCCEIHAFIW